MDSVYQEVNQEVVMEEMDILQFLRGVKYKFKNFERLSGTRHG